MAEMSMPAGFGGLMRYKEEYNSRFKFKPGAVVFAVIAVIAFILCLRIFWPVG